MLGCGAALLSLALGDAGAPFRGGGLIGDGVARVLAEYLNRTGSLIVILTGVLLSVILATQFSFGHLLRELSGRARHEAARSARPLARRRHEPRERTDAGRALGAPCSGRFAEGARFRTRPRLRCVRHAPTRRVPARRGPRGRRRGKPDPKTAGEGPRSRRRDRGGDPATVSGPAPRSCRSEPPIRKPPPAVAPKAVTAGAVRRVAAAGRSSAVAVACSRGRTRRRRLRSSTRPKSVHKIDERQLMDDARRLEARCSEFSVEGVHRPDPPRTRWSRRSSSSRRRV